MVKWEQKLVSKERILEFNTGGNIKVLEIDYSGVLCGEERGVG
jgi:hypothetical protein